MKNRNIIAALLMLVAGMQTSNAQKMVVKLTDNQTVKYNVLQVESVTFEEAGEHEYVDLGLPTGTLWATCNIGANSPEEYGDYFAWGETEPKEDYSWSTYKYCNGSITTLTKYCLKSSYGFNGFIDNKTELEPFDDAATVLWGSNWQIPSREQFKELINSTYTMSVWTLQNGIQGLKITSKINSKWIFLPAAGWCLEMSLKKDIGNYGRYFARSLDDYNAGDYTSYATGLIFKSGEITATSLFNRSLGQSVRPVRVLSPAPVKLVTKITLSDTSITLETGETKQLTATVTPSDATNPDVTWESSDERVATVSSTGLVTAIASNFCGVCTVTCRATDGSDVEAECRVVVGGVINDTHEYVDLELPSGTLWATCNVGASSPEEYGSYFAWGETTAKSNYSWGTYLWMNEGQSDWSQINKYTFADDQTDGCWYRNNTFIGDNKTELVPTDDAATANWGANWQMPSLSQIKELRNTNYTTIQWTTLKGVYGRKITSKKNNKWIFLPAAGYQENTSLESTGSYGYYQARSLNSFICDRAEGLYFDSNAIRVSDGSRYIGHNVRPVRTQ